MVIIRDVKSKYLQSSQKGFTLIELIVVLALIGMLSGIIVNGFNNQRPARSQKIVQNEMVTNIRKVQSYALSSRILPGGQAAQYYVLKFDTSQPNQYSIFGIYNAKNPPIQMRSVETIMMPQDILMTNPVSVYTAGATTTSSCVLIAFQLPYAKEITSRGCTGSPPTVSSSDDYGKIIDFVANNGGTVTSDSIVTINLQDKSGLLPVRKVIINGITGLVTFQ